MVVLSATALCTTPKLTSQPIDDHIVGSQIFVYCIRHIQKRLHGIIYATLIVQEFTLMSLLIRTDDPGEAIGLLLGRGKLNAELLDKLFEMCNFVVYQAWMSVKHEWVGNGRT